MFTAVDSVHALGHSEVIGKEEKQKAVDKTLQILGSKASELLSSSKLVHVMLIAYMTRHCGPELFCNLTCTSKHTLSFS